MSALSCGQLLEGGPCCAKLWGECVRRKVVNWLNKASVSMPLYSSGGQKIKCINRRMKDRNVLTCLKWLKAVGGFLIATLFFFLKMGFERVDYWLLPVPPPSLLLPSVSEAVHWQSPHTAHHLCALLAAESQVWNLSLPLLKSTVTRTTCLWFVARDLDLRNSAKPLRKLCMGAVASWSTCFHGVGKWRFEI